MENTEFLKSLKGEPMGLYDSANGRTLKPYKVVDLTRLTANQPLIIKYAKAKRGLIAQIIELYKAGEDLGVTVHYFLNETSARRLAEDEVFSLRVKMMGADPLDMAIEIYINK